MEFGVWEGATLNGVADYRKVNCDKNAAPVYGFDTFTGLPEDWGSFRPTVFIQTISTPYLTACKNVTSQAPQQTVLAAWTCNILLCTTVT